MANFKTALGAQRYNNKLHAIFENDRQRKENMKTHAEELWHALNGMIHSTEAKDEEQVKEATKTAKELIEKIHPKK